MSCDMAGRWNEALDGLEDLGQGLGRQELLADAFLEQCIEPLAELVLLLALPLCRDVDARNSCQARQTRNKGLSCSRNPFILRL